MVGSRTRVVGMKTNKMHPTVLFSSNRVSMKEYVQACSQTLKKGGANNYYEQGLIQRFLDSNSVQSVSNIGGSGGAPPGKFLIFRTS